MAYVTIHDSGTAGDRLQVDSWFNGLAYNFHFGEAGSPMRNVYLQGDDATAIRDEFDAMEGANPEMESRDIWLTLLDPYLD
jgi:hypothetical protein